MRRSSCSGRSQLIDRHTRSPIESSGGLMILAFKSWAEMHTSQFEDIIARRGGLTDLASWLHVVEEIAPHLTVQIAEKFRSSLFELFQCIYIVQISSAAAVSLSIEHTLSYVDPRALACRVDEQACPESELIRANVRQRPSVRIRSAYHCSKRSGPTPVAFAPDGRRMVPVSKQ
jgi:hypothetical protein